jgi:hypothetical protein
MRAHEKQTTTPIPQNNAMYGMVYILSSGFLAT